MSDEDWKGWYRGGTPNPSGTETSSAGGGPRFSPAPAGGWPSQPPPASQPPPVSEPPTWTSPTYGGRQWRFWGQPGRHGRRIALIAGLVVLVLIVTAVGSYFWLDGKLHKTVTLPVSAVQSAGTNWLIVGSDTREGLTRTQADALHLGSIGANASDSLMLLHTGGGKPVLLSIPRDSYVPIPGHGYNKINAALAFGGPSLLVQTVESVTGLRINHYMGIGFGGLVNVVNKVGGVHMCLKTAVHDSFSGVNLSAGCHNLNGAQSLAFVRDRHSFATSDLQRIQNQRAFLSALLNKATSPGVYLNPFTAYPFASSAAGAISVDKGTSLYQLTQVAFALRGPLTGTVPIADANFPTSAGDAVKWDHTKALALFGALKNDKPVPSGLLNGTKVA